MSQISAELKLPRLLVDSGNVLFGSTRQEIGLSAPTITAAGIAEIYAYMHYNAVAVGPLDLAGGIDFLMETQRLGMPWISANLYDLSDHRLFNPYVTVKIGDISIGILGITGFEVPGNRSFEVRDGITELNGLMPELSAEHDLVIVLSSLSHKQNMELAKRFPEVHIVIGADRRKGAISPVVSNGSLITQTAGQGKYLGMLSVSWAHSPWKIDQENKLVQLNNHLRSANRQLNQLDTEKNKSSQRYQNKLSILEKNKQRLEREISIIEKAQAAGTDGLNQSTFQSSFIALDRSIQEDRKISAMVRSIKDKTTRFKTAHGNAEK